MCVAFRLLREWRQLLSNLALIGIESSRQEIALSSVGDFVFFFAGSVEGHEVETAVGIDLPLCGRVVLGWEPGLLAVPLAFPGASAASLRTF